MELRMGIKKQFGAFHLEADFTLEGERIGLFGPSGSGKSTLVGLLSGLYRPDSGVILLDKEVIFDSRKRMNVPVEHRRIGMVFQRPCLFPHLSVKNNILFGFRRCTREHRKITIEKVVDVLQIGHLLDRGVKNLSGGEMQRVAIGRAVLSNPRLLVMDEPLSGLDDQLKFQIIPFLKNVCETFGIPYLFISHSVVEMRIMTDSVINVAGGRITGQMTADELARVSMGQTRGGYMNLIKPVFSHHQDGLTVYDWGDHHLFISGGSDQPGAMFELSSTEIILFKRHPEAISARNLLKCSVTDIFETGGRLGVELRCGEEILIAEIVRQAADDLGIIKGSDIFAAIKATAFRQLG
jgi:molybdate transport system ATP-binding protein